MSARVCVVGSANMDLVVKGARIAAPGETLSADLFYTAHGGKGANQAVAARRLGADVAFVARVGADAFGEQMIQAYEREGITVTYIQRDANAATGVALIAVDAEGRNAIMVAGGANNRLSVADVESAATVIQSAKVLLLQLETPVDASIAAATLARDAGVTVLLNPAPFRPDVPDALWRLAHVLTPNEHELQGLQPDAPDPATAAVTLSQRTGARVLVTLGAQGVLLTGDNAPDWLPAHRVQAVDTTAAGDCFAGALSVALAEGRPLPDAVGFAQAAAALSVTRLGAQPSLPYRQEVV